MAAESKRFPTVRQLMRVCAYCIFAEHRYSYCSSLLNVALAEGDH